MKEDILKIINETYKKFEENCGDSYFNYDDKFIITDTGYALEGIRLFKDELEKALIMNNIIN